MEYNNDVPYVGKLCVHMPPALDEPVPCNSQEWFVRLSDSLPRKNFIHPRQIWLNGAFEIKQATWEDYNFRFRKMHAVNTPA